MELLFFAGGVTVGAIICKLIDRHTETGGVIDVDHYDNACKVRMTSVDLSDRSKKKVIFRINHEARFSRDEHSL